MNDFSARSSVSDVYKELSVRDLIAPVFRQKRLLVITFISAFAFVILLATLMGSSYASHMEILVNRERQDPLVTTEATTQMIQSSVPVAEEEINSEVELLLSRDVLERVVVENGLALPQPGFSLGDLIHPHQTKEERTARAVKRLAKSIKVKPVAKTDLIEVEYSSSSAALAHSVLQSLGDAYIAKHVSVHRPSGSYEFFTKETQAYHDQLQASEAKLRDFGKTTGVAAPDLQRTDMALQVAAATGLLHTARQTEAADEGRIKSDLRQMSITPNRSATARSTADADMLLTNLNTALLAAQNKRAVLGLKYDPNYPLVREADEEVAQAQAAIAAAQKARFTTETTDRDPTYELLREDLARAQIDSAAQRATIEATTRSIAAMQSQMVSLDQAALTQQDLLRDERANESNYLLYLSKREQERTSDALDLKRIANVAIAVPPAIPVLPVFSWPLILMVAFGAGLVLALSVAYIVDYLDPSFHSPSQVARTLGIPVVVAFSKRAA